MINNIQLVQRLNIQSLLIPQMMVFSDIFRRLLNKSKLIQWQNDNFFFEFKVYRYHILQYSVTYSIRRPYNICNTILYSSATNHETKISWDYSL